MNTLLETPHGSRLYRLHHEESDNDRFQVVEDNPTVKARYSKHKISGDHDLVICDLTTFTAYASRGVPQYLEAMWTPCPTVDRITDLRMSFSPNYYQTQDTYQRTAHNFYVKGKEETDSRKSVKFRRHAYRLVLNLQDYRSNGMFNPALTDQQIYQLKAMLLEDRHPDHYLAL
jgi:hypothetical protein